MPDGRDAIAVRVLSRIDEVPAAEWDACAGADSPFLRHAFLDALEASGSTTAETGWLPQQLPDGVDAVLADTRWPDGALHGFRLARQAGVPAILDADLPVPADGELLRMATHVAFSAAGLEAGRRSRRGRAAGGGRERESGPGLAGSAPPGTSDHRKGVGRYRPASDL